MRNKHGLRYKLTVYIGLILFISNMLFIGLLFHNYYIMSKGVEVEINGSLEVFYYYDYFEAKLLLAGIIIAICSTALGTFLSYFLLGKLLKPLNQLTNHMRNVNNKNLTDKAEIDSDIFEVDSLIESFNIMNEKLKKKIESQKNFSSYIAHELRNPLSVIIARVGVSKMDPDKSVEKFNAALDMIEMQSEKMGNLITQILNITRVNGVELTEEIDINLLLDDVVQNLTEKAYEKNVKIDFVYDEHSKDNIFITGSYKLLYQAFFNIIENGIKYNYENGKVSVKTHRDYKGNFIVNIKDTGRGIDYEERDNIFCPFYRSKSKKNENISGNGIGLAFAKEIFEHHKGSIELLDIKEESGTEFEINLKENL